MDIVKLQSCSTLKPFNSGYQAKMRNGVHLSFSSFTVASSVLGLYTTEAPQGKDFVNGSFFPTSLLKLVRFFQLSREPNFQEGIFVKLSQGCPIRS